MGALKRLCFVAAYAFGAALSSGCAGTGVPPGTPPAEVIQRAQEKIAKKDWLDAIEILDGFVRANPGASLIPEAKMRLGDARFGLEEYALARGEYQDVVDDSPTSPFVVEARYKIARCVYASVYDFDRDPSETEAAITLLDSFLREFPESQFAPDAKAALADCRGRLARREFETGRFYEGRHRKRSAIIQYQYVVSQYPDTEWAPKALLRLGELYTSRGERDAALASYRKLLDLAPDSEEAKTAEAALADFPMPGPTP